jgi:hypothetical protein
VESSGSKALRRKVFYFRQSKGDEIMENNTEIVEIVELTVEELEERTAPGVIVGF